MPLNGSKLGMQKTVKQIADFIGGEVEGDSRLVIDGVSGLKEAQKGHISFLSNSKYCSLLEKSLASCVIVDENAKSSSKTIIRVKNPSLSFVKVVELFSDYQLKCISGVSKKSSVADDAKLGKNVAVGDFAVVGEGAKIGNNTLVYSGAYVGNNVVIGSDCVIHPNVVIRENVIIGDRVIIHACSVIGADGFGYIQVENKNFKIPQVGTVVIEDDVEIGACTTIDRARFGKTLVGKCTKIDNLVQVGHNVEIGENCIIISQVGISGSTKIGKNVILAGQSGVAGHLSIGDNVVLGARGGIIKSVPANSYVSGYPARSNLRTMKSYAALDMLPDLIKEFNVVKRKLAQMEKDINGKSKDVKC